MTISRDARPARGGGASSGRSTATRRPALREAFLIVSRLRLAHHADVRPARAARPRTAIVPAELPPLAREELFSALRAIADAQKQLSVYAPLGI